MKSPKANAIIPVGVQAMLGPVVCAGHPGRLIAVKQADSAVPVRFAAQAELLVVLGADGAEIFELENGDAKPEPTHYGYPYARGRGDPAKGPRPRVFPAELILRRWQLGLAGEITGALAGALGYLVAYLSQREQFDRKLGAFQAIQHRLSELAVTLEAVRHLALEAAWSDRLDCGGGGRVLRRRCGAQDVPGGAPAERRARASRWKPVCTPGPCACTR